MFGREYRGVTSRAARGPSRGVRYGTVVVGSGQGGGVITTGHSGGHTAGVARPRRPFRYLHLRHGQVRARVVVVGVFGRVGSGAALIAVLDVLSSQGGRRFPFVVCLSVCLDVTGCIYLCAVRLDGKTGSGTFGGLTWETELQYRIVQHGTVLYISTRGLSRRFDVVLHSFQVSIFGQIAASTEIESRSGHRLERVKNPH